MNYQHFYHGTKLSERVASLQITQKLKSKKAINSELAQRRIQRWRSQAPFNKNNSLFMKRLELDGIGEDELFQLLGEPLESLQERFLDLPSWLNRLAKIFSNLPNDTLKPLPLLEDIQGKEISLFLYILEPLISYGRQQLEREVTKISQTYPKLPFNFQTILEVFEAHLAKKLLSISSRTMVLELHIAGLQGLLAGETTQERFYNFVEQLRQPGRLLAFLEEYPILARQLVISIEQWVRFSWEFLDHLSADWNQIKATFSPESDPGQLVAVSSEGDSHRDGRYVAVAKFSSGFQIVYKPRTLSVGVHFQQLLTWVNEKSNRLQFKTIKILDRPSYGWVEYIAPQNCTSKEQVSRFYQRQGGYLALLYALEAIDFHHENLIAAGEHPVLIDLESLFHPHITKTDLTQSSSLARDTLNNSVLRVGLLPQRLWSDGERDGLDISGLGGKDGQLTPYEIPYWDRMGTDRMRVQRKRMKLPQQNNQPQLNDHKVDLLNYVDAICDGFTETYHLLLTHRDELLSAGGIIAQFAGDEVRAILRPTRLYVKLLRDSCHPKMLRNALERERLFDRLWCAVEHQPYMAKVIAAERQDLWHGDVPIFTTRPNSRDLFTSFGEPIVDLYEESGMSMIQRRWHNLSESDLKQQIYFIKASMTSIEMSLEQAKFPHYPLREPKTLTNREQLLTAAKAIGERLERLAIRGENDAIWIGLKPIDERYWTLTPSGLDFYNGLPGITLFLSYLGAIAPEKGYTRLAKAALTTIKSQLEQGKLFLKSIGAYDGWGGIIYTLTHLGLLWNEPDLLAEAEELVTLLPPLIEEDRGLDLVAGAAGCLMSLLSLYRCTGSESTLATAIACGDHLIATAQTMPQGIGWVIPNPEPTLETQPLTGFAHGAAGIAAALLELWAVTGAERFKTTALAAIAYERSLFLPELGNWPDLRNFSHTVLSGKKNRARCAIAWCHGAAGIGLARLHSLTHLDDAAIRSEIATAIQTTINKGFGGNHSLCHGDLGNLELLLQAYLVLNEPQWKTQVDYFASMILESIEGHGWLCGVPLGVETPGLMTGLAGIGYELLRLAAPEQIPSVLLLEPPRNLLINNVISINTGEKLCQT